MMRVLLDTNVVLDYLLNRMPWADHAQVIWQAHEAGRLNAHIAATTLTDIFYIVRKGLGLDLAWTGVHTCLDQLIVVGVDLPDLRSACSFSGRDFEDNLQLACAVNIGAQYIITRDPAGFADASIPVVSSEEMANLLRSSAAPTQDQS